MLHVVVLHVAFSPSRLDAGVRVGGNVDVDVGKGKGMGRGRGDLVGGTCGDACDVAKPACGCGGCGGCGWGCGCACDLVCVASSRLTAVVAAAGL